MITLTREEAQQVLDALEYGIDYVKSEETTNKQTYKGYEHLCPDDSYYIKFIDDAMETLRARLSAPEPEYRDVVIKGDLWRIEFLPDHAASVVLVRANYEAKLKEKNT